MSGDRRFLSTVVEELRRRRLRCDPNMTTARRLILRDEVTGEESLYWWLEKLPSDIDDSFIEILQKLGHDPHGLVRMMAEAEASRERQHPIRATLGENRHIELVVDYVGQLIEAYRNNGTLGQKDINLVKLENWNSGSAQFSGQWHE